MIEILATDSANTHWTGLYAIIAALIGALASGVITYFIGLKAGRKGKLVGFDTFQSPLSLGDVKWSLAFTEPDGTKKEGGVVTFNQSGSRITGIVVLRAENRVWEFEGAVSDRFLCYVYADKDPNTMSFGAVISEMASDGKEMNGKWIGWDSNTGELAGGDVTLAS